MSYWVIAVPAEHDEARARDRLIQGTVKRGLCKQWVFKIPNLKVGTLDTLVMLSEDLAKIDAQAHQVVQKIQRAYIDISKSEPSAAAGAAAAGERQESPELQVNKKSIHAFVSEFEWDGIHFPKASALKGLADKVLQDCQGADEELKKNLTAYNEVKTKFTAIERKETGSLMVKPLGQFIREEHIIEREYITTKFVIVPVAREQEFLDTYEILEDLHAERQKELELERQKQKEAREAQLRASGQAPKEEPTPAPASEEKEDAPKERVGGVSCKNVVPRSALKLTPNGYPDEFCLYRVLVFRKGADQFGNLCREKRYIIRAYTHDPDEAANSRKEKEELQKNRQKLWKFLVMWCKTNFSAIFSKWVHVKAMRVFVESVLRYGLPVDFASFILQPTPGKESATRKALGALYQNLGGQGADAGGEDAQDIAGLGGGEFYPYVYLALETE
jgi:V-type H+-transporting ATPase subunit C